MISDRYSNSGKPDYMLLSNGNVVALIEAKKLAGKLDGRKEIDQLLNYVSETARLKYVVCTDGDLWHIRVKKRKMTLESFQLSKMQEFECAVTALRLWRGSLEVEERGASSPAPAQTRPPTSHDDSVRPTPKPKPANNGDWKPLTSLKVKSGQKAPASIRFSNSSPKPIKSWADLLGSVAEHLVETGKISAGDCPVRKSERAETYLVHTEPTHPGDDKFSRSRKIGKLWLNTHGNAIEMHKNACWLLENFGIDPSTVLISTNPS